VDFNASKGLPMKKKIFGIREFVILAVLLLSCYTIWPSIQIHTRMGEAKKAFIKENPKLAGKAVNFGLDLAGGTSITLEIDKTALKEDEIKDIQAQSLEIVRNRVDQFGLSEPQIAPSGDSRIVVELAGVDDSTAKSLVGSTAKLEFKILSENEKFTQVVGLVDNYLTHQTGTSDTVKTDSTAKDSAITAASADSLSDADLLVGSAAKAETVAKKDSAPAAGAVLDSLTGIGNTPLSQLYLSFGNGGFVHQDNVEKVKRILANKTIQGLIPRDAGFVWGSGLETVKGSVVKGKRLYLLKRRAEMNGEDISDARPYRVGDGTNAGEVAVSLKFSGIGPKKFSAVTAANIGKQMAIVLDDQVISAPVIRDRIPNGEAQITGLDDMAEANRLAVVLRAGALKAPMNIIESRNIGATLGVDNIKSGFGSALLGLVACLIFMIGYYRLGGAVASVGMMFNVLITAAVLSVFNATLTLPGIAGFILSIAMSLDSNVIIFERIREEIRDGLKARAAVAKGYEKAFSAIFDSNLTTFLTALILYKIGTGSVKGFGLTLMIGIVSSMFSALTVTHAIFDFKLARQDANHLKLGSGVRAINEARFTVVPKTKIFFSLSAVLIVFSLGLAIVKGFDFSIDFVGGQVYTVQFQDEKSHEAELAAAITAKGADDFTVRKVGSGSNNSYQISVRKSQDAAVKDAVTGVHSANGQAADIIAMDTVGPTIGKELRFNAILSVFLACIMICLYIWFRFGKLGLGFGVGAVLGLVHDTILTVGMVSLFGLSVDGALIASILTMIGYSVNDTIVVFDRIRENVGTMGRANFGDTVDTSVSQSFSRTIITSMTTLFVCIILAVMGGSSIRDLGLVLAFGIITGTYSSIFICSPFVAWWAKRFKRGV
jgi:SecD/SecF fusion protein